MLRVDNDTIKLQARDSVRLSCDRDDITNSFHENNILAQTAMQEIPRDKVMEPRTTLEERRLQIAELDEWQTKVKEKSRIHDERKQCHDKLKGESNQLKVGDKVLVDEADPPVATFEPNGAIPFAVLNIFPYGIVEVTHSEFGTFKVNSTHLKPYFDKIDSRNEEF
ncbi:hypothetical protein GOBAR_AA32522 [Gossypium barbadense]|uniref:Uncharacterized protein n=1 Tax=Gossypium barbadense TaxID=3634 RepID=A0A2P5WAT4_GOSBA|nr:hypothetical protein GOBAR_AA32522 [Gossypium barbadense]